MTRLVWWWVAIGAVAPASAHVFIPEAYRLGSFPAYGGIGWQCEAYLLPESAAANLFEAEAYASGALPDFTFQTPWIDFPAGPVTEAPDADFENVGDFLDEHITDVSEGWYFRRRDAAFDKYLATLQIDPVGCQVVGLARPQTASVH